jgi:hypothetical protein
MESVTRREILRLGGISSIALVSDIVPGRSQSVQPPDSTAATSNGTERGTRSRSAGAGQQPESARAVSEQVETPSPTPSENRECEPAAFERDENGDISFERGPVRFESASDIIDLSRTEMPRIDIEITAVGIDLLIETDSETLELDVTEAETDLEGSGTDPEVELENNDVEYRTANIDLEWTPEKLDIDRPVNVDYRNSEFEYRDSALQFEWDRKRRKFEFDCRL